MRFSKVCAFVAAAMVAVVGRSADYVWNSSVSEGEWLDAKNWLVNGEVPATAPGKDDTVNFKGVSATVLLSDNQVCILLSSNLSCSHLQDQLFQ